MNLEQLEYFIEIANCGNLSKSAEKLGVSQPALSKYLANLEEAMQVKFFISEKRMLKLTTPGKIYYDMAVRVVNANKKTQQMIDRVLDRSVETIRVGASPHRGSQLIGRVYTKFIEKYPHVSVDITECYLTEGLKLLEENKIDLLIGTTDTMYSSKTKKIIMYSEEVVLTVPIYHPLAELAKSDLSELTPIDPSEFINDPWIIMERGATLYKVTEKLFKEYKISPTVVFKNKSIHVLNSFLKEGSCVGLLPKSYVDFAQNNCVYFTLEPKKYVYLSVYYGENRVLTEAEKYFLALIMDADKDAPSLNHDRNQEAEEIYSEFLQEKSML